jgi:4-amino-4-deoxy-L-arabinose transferase-like glycosyltransferase
MVGHTNSATLPSIRTRPAQSWSFLEAAPTFFSGSFPSSQLHRLEKRIKGLTSHNKRRRLHIFAILIIGLLGGLFWLEIQLDFPCQIDEPFWMNSGYLTYQLFTSRAGLQRWEKAYKQRKLGDWGHKNPPIGKLLIGAFVASLKDADDSVKYRWTYPKSYYENYRSGTLPPLSLLRTTRFGIACCSLLTMLFLYLLALELLGTTWLALLAPILLYSIPVFRAHSLIVYTDLPQLLFLVTGLYLFLRYIRTSQVRMLLFASFSFGLSCAVKFNAGVVVVAALGFILLQTKPLQHRLWISFITVFTSVSAFILVNPFLYTNPIHKTQNIINSWSATKKKQQRDPTLAKGSLSTTTQKLQHMVKRAFLNPFDTPPFGLAFFIWVLKPAGSMIVLLLLILIGSAGIGFTFQEHPLQKWRLLILSCTTVSILLYSLLFRHLGGIFGALVILGLVGLIHKHTWLVPHEENQAWKRQQGLFLCFYFGTAFVLTGLWLPFDWSRYYLPVIMILPIFALAGIKLFSDGLLKKRIPDTPQLGMRPSASRKITVGLGIGLCFVVYSLLFLSLTRRENKLNRHTKIYQILHMWEQSPPKQKLQLSLFLLGKLYTLNRYKEAHIEANIALQKAPKNPIVLAWHAMVLYRLGKQQRARKSLALAKQLGAHLRIVKIATQLIPMPSSRP